MDERHIVDIWLLFKEHVDKKQIDTVAERYVDLLADYGISDEMFQESFGTDTALDNAIKYYLDMDAEDVYDDEDNLNWED
tara:strand:- start:252 stop:491 length:240 start_codon:yes stop_codon:yes gene_type:complete